VPLIKARSAEEISREKILVYNFNAIRPAPPHAVPRHEGFQAHLRKSGLNSSFRSRPRDNGYPRNARISRRGNNNGIHCIGGGETGKASATKSPMNLSGGVSGSFTILYTNVIEVKKIRQGRSFLAWIWRGDNERFDNSLHGRAATPSREA